MGAVEGIWVAGVAGGRAHPVEIAEARAGIGLLGDRYAARAGYWRDARVSRDLTLIEAEVADDLVSGRIIAGAADLRRNVATRGVRLNGLVGRTFWIGSVLAQGTHLCEPCQHLEDLTQTALLRRLVHRGGLRARLLTDGPIRVGDAIEEVSEQAGVGVIVRRDRRILLGRRLSAHGFGTWGLPGGKPLYDESAIECALRELVEETGLNAKHACVVGESLDGFPESRQVFRTQFVEVGMVKGEPELREPEKTSEWRWSGTQSLPGPLFRPVASLLSKGYTP